MQMTGHKTRAVFERYNIVSRETYVTPLSGSTVRIQRRVVVAHISRRLARVGFCTALLNAAEG